MYPCYVKALLHVPQVLEACPLARLDSQEFIGTAVGASGSLPSLTKPQGGRNILGRTRTSYPPLQSTMLLQLFCEGRMLPEIFRTSCPHSTSFAKPSGAWSQSQNHHHMWVCRDSETSGTRRLHYCLATRRFMWAASTRKWKLHTKWTPLFEAVQYPGLVSCNCLTFRSFGISFLSKHGRMNKFLQGRHRDFLAFAIPASMGNSLQLLGGDISACLKQSSRLQRHLMLHLWPKDVEQIFRRQCRGQMINSMQAMREVPVAFVMLVHLPAYCFGTLALLFVSLGFVPANARDVSTVQGSVFPSASLLLA